MRVAALYYPAFRGGGVMVRTRGKEEAEREKMETPNTGREAG
jgi:hypothetical protein